MQELFEEALTRPREERPSFLAEACGDDAELRAEVDSLLVHHEEASADFPPPPQRDPLLGSSIGDFRIKNMIGRGGMATVYAAVQQDPHRTVALKVMRRNIGSRSALRRFRF